MKKKGLICKKICYNFTEYKIIEKGDSFIQIIKKLIWGSVRV